MILNKKMMKPEDVETALIIPGGAGDGLGMSIGALKALQPYWDANGIQIDGVVGTSQGALIGAQYAEIPNQAGIDAAEELYMSLTQKLLFGRSGFFLDVELLIRQLRIQINPNSINSLIEGDHIRSHLRDIFGNRTIGEMTLPFGATVMDLSHARYRVINNVADPNFLTAWAAYASAAMVPFLDPMYVVTGGGSETLTLVDGGARHVIPFESAVALWPNLRSVWILAKHGAQNANRGKVEGALSIAESTIDSIVNQNIFETLTKIGDGSDEIEAHLIIVGEGIEFSDFFNFTDRLKEFVGGGEDNALKYLADPKPTMVTPRHWPILTSSIHTEVWYE